MKNTIVLMIVILLLTIIIVLSAFLPITSKPEVNTVKSPGRSNSREQRSSPLPESEDPLGLYKNWRDNEGEYIQNLISSNTDTIKTQSKHTGPNFTDYIYRGANIAIERVVTRHEEARRLLGSEPLKYPYKAQMEDIYTIVSNAGYDRNALFEYYKPVLELTLTLTDDLLRNAPKTSSILQLFANNDISKIDMLIKQRLQSNRNDVVALLLKHNLYTEQGQGDDVFANARRIIDALHDVEFAGVDKRAIVCHLLDDLSMTFAYQTEEQSNNINRKRITNSCYPILYMMEIAEDW